MNKEVIIMGVKGFKIEKEYSKDYFQSNIEGENYLFYYGIDKYGCEIRKEFDDVLSTPLTDEEFDMLIGYIEGHGYMPVINEDTLYRHNIEDSGDELQEYDASEFISYVSEGNYDLISDCELPGDAKYLSELKEDEKVIDIIVSRLV